MTDKKISELGTITQGDIASGDWIAVVDSSENATKKFDFSVVIAATNSFDDVTTFFASTDTYAADTIVGTRAEGFAYKAVDTATATTVANAGGQAFEVLPRGQQVTMQQFGCFNDPDNDIDSVSEFQKAITACHENKWQLFVDGSFYLSDTSILCPTSVNIAGADQGGRSYGDPSDIKRRSEIRTSATKVFVGANGEADDTKFDCSGVSFVNQLPRGTTAPADDAALFADMVIRGGRIDKNLIFGYGSIMRDGRFGRATRFENNNCEQIRYKGFYISGVGTSTNVFLDSFACRNYFNGDPTKNATLFGGPISSTAVSTNYIDFFKHVFDLTAGVWQRARITDNTIEFNYRVFHGDVVADAVTKAIISGNNFHANKAAKAISLFANPDGDMSSNEWGVFGVKSVSQSSVYGNFFQDNGFAANMEGYNFFDLVFGPNIYKDNDVDVNWVWQKVSAMDPTTVRFIDLNDLRVGSLPNASFSGTALDKSSFDKQKIIFDGKCIFNDNGVWRFFDGTEYDAPIIGSFSDTETFTAWTTDQGTGTGYLVVTTSAEPPSAAQIISGQNEIGAAAAAVDTVAVASTNPASFTYTLSAGSYFSHAVHVNSAGYISRTSSGSGFTV